MKRDWGVYLEADIHLPDGQITSTSGSIAPSIPSRKNILLCLSGKSSL
jgi:hypothetical protein